MGVWIVTGGLGAGKSLIATSRAREGLERGVPIASNMWFNIEHLVAGRKKYKLIRLADYPKLEDFETLGCSCCGGPAHEVPALDEKKFGYIILDEVATFLNNREWNRDLNDEGPKEGAQKRAVKARLDLIKWLRHARKHRWHLYFITQGVNSLDSQIRNEMLEHEVRCRRMDRMTVPVLSILTKVLGFGAIPLPQVHVGVVYYNEVGRPTKIDSWYVPDAKSLYPAYNTTQVLSGECLGATMLSIDRAPYLWKPRGLREWLWEKLLWRWWPPSEARQRYDDCQLYLRGLSRYRQPPVAFHAWDSARRVCATGDGVRSWLRGAQVDAAPPVGQVEEMESDALLTAAE